MKIYTIFNPTRFQEVDIERGNKEVIEQKLIELKTKYPLEDLIVMECA